MLFKKRILKSDTIQVYSQCHLCLKKPHKDVLNQIIPQEGTAHIFYYVTIQLSLKNIILASVYLAINVRLDASTGHDMDLCNICFNYWFSIVRRHAPIQMKIYIYL